MPNRLIPLLSLAVALYGTGAAIVAFSSQYGVLAAPIAQSTPAATPLQSITLLPTIVVRPAPEVPVLATVTVRPTHAERVDASSVEVDDSLAQNGRISYSAVVPSGGFDMPYYSFGKSLRRANEE